MKLMVHQSIPLGRAKKDQQTTIVGASLLVRSDSDTGRWVVALVSRTSREDVPVAWKQTEEDALAWALNYGVRK